MVKAKVNVGFICEGRSEVELIKSDNFNELLKENNIQKVGRPIDCKGNGNLLPHNIKKYNQKLKEADIIIILADLETDPCVTKTRNRIKPNKDIHTLIVERKKIESWFLSDNNAMEKLTGKAYKGNPEKLATPDIELKKRLRETNKWRGLGHAELADICISEGGFDIRNSNCDSAKYFVEKLKKIATQTTISTTSKSKRKKKKN